MKRLILTALLTSAVWAHAQTASAPAAPASPAKKALVQKLLQLQQPGIEKLASNLVEQPAMQMLQAAGRALQQQVPPEKREAMGKSIEADVRKFVDDSVPIVRDKAVKLAPSTIGAMMEEKFTEDELKQLIAWLESPVNKKYSEIGPEIQNSFTQKLVAEARPIVDPRLQALEAKVRTTLGVPPPAPAGSAPAKAAAPAKKAASK
ncbi:MAG: DUF2059 domain-containing protein [Burkholderiales bacterium]|nr:DUF2059 domain-containing protein [Burkholderiales bacterium]